MFRFLHGRSAWGRFSPLQGARVVLRPPRHSDWRAWADLRTASRDFLTPWEPTWSHDGLTRRAFRRRVRQHHVDWRDRAGYAFFVLGRDDGRLLGGITVSDVQRGVAQACQLGYWVGAPYARQGYMSEALALTLGFVFRDLGLHRATAACLPGNRASQGLLRKLGFREEGYARDFLRIDGRWQDHVLFAQLAEEFETLRMPQRLGRAAE